MKKVLLAVCVIGTVAAGSAQAQAPDTREPELEMISASDGFAFAKAKRHYGTSRVRSARW